MSRLVINGLIPIALEMAERAYVLEGGRIALEGKGSDLLHDDKVRESFLGV